MPRQTTIDEGEILKLPDLSRAISKYETAKAAFNEAKDPVQRTKLNVVAKLKEHREKLAASNPSGEVSYLKSGKVYSLKPGEEELAVKKLKMGAAEDDLDETAEEGEE